MDSPSFPIQAAASVAIVSCVVVALSDVLAWSLIVDAYSPVRETISALAVGDGSWLLDIGLWCFAAGCVALGMGMYRFWLDGRAWSLAAYAVTFLGPVVGVIAFFNEYAGQKNAGADIHLIAVFTLGMLVASAAFLIMPSLNRLDPRLARRSLFFGLAWVILAPLFFFVPDGWDGGYERLLALMILGWVTSLSIFLFHRA